MVVNYKHPEEDTAYWYAVMEASDAGDVLYGISLTPLREAEKLELDKWLTEYSRRHPRKFWDMPVITRKRRSQFGTISTALAFLVALTIAGTGHAIWKALVGFLLCEIIMAIIEITLYEFLKNTKRRM